MIRYRLGWLILFLLITLVLGLSSIGCVKMTEVANQPTPEGSLMLSRPVPRDEWHDVSIISLDFDPALKSGSLSQTTITRSSLLAAVENKGTQTERNLTVEVRVSGEANGDTLLTRSQTIDLLAAGEVKVVRFGSFEDIPPRADYFVQVRVLPVSAEVDLTNNQKTLHIRVGY
ncbi:MAG: hypothetical protein M1136_00700 [Chloroflexi bacterium]|nr:hypothetical protein [Chloroflexota bacterium]